MGHPRRGRGAVLSFVLLHGFAFSLFWLSVQAPLVVAAAPGYLQSDAVPRAPETREAPESYVAPHPEIAPDSKRVPGSGQSGDDAQVSGGHAAEVQQLAEKYLDAQRDGTIYDLVPGGNQVDPAYVGAFLYALTDLKSATRFGGSPEALQELRDKALAYEERFLAGEDLGTSVHITRGDGSVFASDGKYRLID